MHPGHVVFRRWQERSLAQSSRATIDWIRWLLERLRSTRGKVGVSALDDDWLRRYEQESSKRGDGR
jgi:hypothetical protein